MKQLHEIISKIHSWPEEVRVLLAGALFILSVFAVYEMWNINLTSNLGSLGQDNFQVAQIDSQNSANSSAENQNNSQDQQTQTPENQPVSPLAGIGESFSSITKIFPGNFFNDDALGSTIKNLGASISEKTGDEINKISNFLFY